MENGYRYFTLYKLDNKIIELGRVKISYYAFPLDAAKKLLNSICKYKGLKKNNKLKCKAIYYIREITQNIDKKIYGPYTGTYKKYDKPVIVKLKNNTIIKHTMYPHVFKLKNKKKIYVQKGGTNDRLTKIFSLNNKINYIYQLLDGTILVATDEDVLIFKNGNLTYKKNDNYNNDNYLKITQKNNFFKPSVYSIIEMNDFILCACADGSIQIFDKNLKFLKIIYICDFDTVSIIKLDDDTLAFYYNSTITVCKLSGNEKEIIFSNANSIKCKFNSRISSIVAISSDKILISFYSANFCIWNYKDIKLTSNNKKLTSNNKVSIEDYSSILNNEDLKDCIKLQDGILIMASNEKLIFCDINFNILFTMKIEDKFIMKIIQLKNGNIMCYYNYSCLIKILEKNNKEKIEWITIETINLEEEFNTFIELSNGNILFGNENGSLYQLNMNSTPQLLQ